MEWHLFTVVHLQGHCGAAAPHAGHDCQRRHGNIHSNLQYPAASALRRWRQIADYVGACENALLCAVDVYCVDCGFLMIVGVAVVIAAAAVFVLALGFFSSDNVDLVCCCSWG